VAGRIVTDDAGNRNLCPITDVFVHQEVSPFVGQGNIVLDVIDIAHIGISAVLSWT